MHSANSHAPHGTIRTVASDPMSAGVRHAVVGHPCEEHRQVQTEEDPRYEDLADVRQLTRGRVLQSTAFHTTLTTTILQNATSTAGDSARLTSVELSENATTSPTTARTRASGRSTRDVRGSASLMTAQRHAARSPPDTTDWASRNTRHAPRTPPASGPDDDEVAGVSLVCGPLIARRPAGGAGHSARRIARS